ncbi:MarR family winged helix-turn-helix transcriptional regulator [Rhizobium sp. NRK18]|jgi:MarR family transcriptional regulator, lower aerobic nicotinate degradation pathway regulator|uniref:MarR family winged helix-turn-helix transcriptional regulator n=1 Tax=Rhizobium sp. NRK18 TaxID=2964667 RepID=UPI0021C3F74F|nr:MarR family transcriptional regulator [Rhizobium sp. NRK18]MCQ2002641.1 MarR family transcriptional regulator [Rhizobium sp. NRK18]
MDSNDKNALPANRDGYRLEDQIGYLLRLANQRHTSIFQEHFPERLTATQFSAMARLADVGPCSQNQLGRLTAMDVATIKGVVDRLKAKELVAITASESDRRRSLISLTYKGQTLLDALYQTGFEVSRLTLAPLSAEESRTLVTLLAKIT